MIVVAKRQRRSITLGEPGRRQLDVAIVAQKQRVLCVCVAVVQQQTGQRERRWITWAAAAVTALLIGGAATLSILKAQADDEYVAYIYGERVTDREVVLSEMHKTMAAISNDGSDIVEEQLKSMFAN